MLGPLKRPTSENTFYREHILYFIASKAADVNTPRLEQLLEAIKYRMCSL